MFEHFKSAPIITGFMPHDHNNKKVRTAHNAAQSGEHRLKEELRLTAIITVSGHNPTQNNRLSNICVAMWMCLFLLLSLSALHLLLHSHPADCSRKRQSQARTPGSAAGLAVSPESRD